MISTDIITPFSLTPSPSVYSSPNRSRLWTNILDRTLRVGFQCDTELSLVKKLASGLRWIEMIPSEYREIYTALYDEAKEFKISKKERGKIEKDVYRTFSLFTRYPGKVRLGQIPEFGTEKMDAYINSLASILLASSHERGYCQGQNFLVAVFILNECTDRESFTLLNFLLSQRYLEILFNPRCSSLVEYMKVFEKRLRKNNKKVYDHLKKNGFSPVCYAIEWFTTCFITTAPGDLSLATLDMIFMGIDNSLLRVGLALMDILEDNILSSNQEQLQMSFKDFVMTADPALVIPRALSLPTKKDNILAKMVSNIQKMNPTLDLVNTLWSPRPKSPSIETISSENDDEDIRSVSPLLFDSQIITEISYHDCADSEKDVEIATTATKTDVFKKSREPAHDYVIKTTESMSTSSKPHSNRIIRRIFLLKRRRREKLLLSPAYIKDRSHRIIVKRKSVLIGDTDDDDENIMKTKNKKNVKGNAVALFFEEALDTTKLGLIKLFSPLNKRSETIKVNSNSSDSGSATARNSRDSSLSPTTVAAYTSKSFKDDPFKSYGYGLSFSPFYQDYVMGEQNKSTKDNKVVEIKESNSNFITTTCQPNLNITPLVETLMKTSSFEESGSPRQSIPNTADVSGSSPTPRFTASTSEDHGFILVDSMKAVETNSRRMTTRKIIRNDGEIYMINIRIRERKMRPRVLTRPKGSQNWPKRIFKWPKIKTAYSRHHGNVPVSSRILDTVIWVSTFGVFGNTVIKKKARKIKVDNSDTAFSDSTCASNNIDNTTIKKSEIKVNTINKDISTNMSNNTKTNRHDIIVKKGYLGDDDDNRNSSENDENTWVTRIPFSNPKTETSDI